MFLGKFKWGRKYLVIILVYDQDDRMNSVISVISLVKSTEMV